MLFVVGVGVVLAGFVGMQRSVVAPILSLQRAARRMAAGKFDASVPPVGEGELGELARAFEHMRDELQKSWARHAALLAELEARVGELQVLHAVSRAATQARDLQELLSGVVAEVKRRLPWEHVWVLLREGDRLRVQAGDQTPLRELSITEGITGWVARTGEPALVPDVHADSRYRVGVAHTRSELCVPLEVGERVIGALNVESPREAAFSDHDLRLLSTIADEVSLAVERAQLYETAQRRLGELTSLLEVSRVLRAATTVAELASLLSERAAQLVRCDAAVVCMVDPAENCIRAVGGYGLPASVEGCRHGIGEGIAGEVVRARSPYRSRCLAADPLAVDRELVAGLGPGLCTPLLSSEGEVVGTLLVGRRCGAPDFSGDEERLQTLAEMGGNALQRARLFEQLEEAYLQAMVDLNRALDARDSATGQHSNRIAVLATAVAEALGCSREERTEIWWAGILHDIGKLAVPDEILRKPGPLTEEERKVVSRHPVVGAEIVAPLRRLARVVPLVRSHHERWDGTGYPDGLVGEQIPLGARVLAVVDAYVAMTEQRPYRPARSHQEALEELRRQAGAQFDPQVVDAFCRVVEQRGHGAGNGGEGP